jgi:S-DNA-T family DNA segregation ATPase FtsK/SpoIIIE
MTDHAHAIESVLSEFGIDARIDNVTHGPSVSRYELKLGNGVRVEKIAGMDQQIAYATGARSVRVIAPIPGKTAVGIELPAAVRQTVKFADALAAIPHDAHPLTMVLGQTVDGDFLSTNLAEAPHLLVAGTTGSGKSVWLNGALTSILRRATPDQVQMTLIDPKFVEMQPYNGIAHLMRPVVSDTDEAVTALNDLVEIMESRYRDMQAAGVRHIDQLPGNPYIVVVVDELADLVMQAGKDVEVPITRLAQKGRAAGLHCIVATQRPSADIITGLIRANFPSRLSFAVQSAVNSRIVLDQGGAETLMGMGDALFAPVGSRDAIRVQGAYVTDEEIAAAVKEWTVETGSKTGSTQIVCPEGTSCIVDELIDQAGAAMQRIDRYLNNIGDPTAENAVLAQRRGETELSTAALAIYDIIHGLKEIKKV